VQWRDGFLRQYRYLSPECCPLQPVLLVPDPDGEEAATPQLDKRELAASRPRTRFRTGQQQRSTCETNQEDQSCQVTCEKSPGVFMKWRNKRRNTKCCNC